MSTTMKLTAKLKANSSQSGMRISGTLVAVNAAGITYPQYYGNPPQDSASAAPSSSIIFAPSPFRIGVNIHTGGGSTAGNIAVANILQLRNFTVARMDLFGPTSNATVRDQIQRINANGGKVQGILLTDQQNDHTVYTSAAQLSALEAANYSQATVLINAFKDIVLDFEILNEINLRAEATAQVAFNSGTNSAAYAGSTAFISLTRAVKGMTRALSDIRASSGLALRSILGIAGRDWGMLSYMATNGVSWDVTGWHYYESNNVPGATDPFWGTGGGIAKMQSFGVPYTVNEFNAWEPASATYVNCSGTTAERGFSSLATHSRLFYQHPSPTAMDSLVYYEMFDTDPLGPFGLMFSAGAAKIPVYIAAAFAGGTLTQSESAELSSRNLFSAGEILAMRHT